jgi:hypothetical protein
MKYLSDLRVLRGIKKIARGALYDVIPNNATIRSGGGTFPLSIPVRSLHPPSAAVRDDTGVNTNRHEYMCVFTCIVVLKKECPQVIILSCPLYAGIRFFKTDFFQTPAQGGGDRTIYWIALSSAFASLQRDFLAMTSRGKRPRVTDCLLPLALSPSPPAFLPSP